MTTSRHTFHHADGGTPEQVWTTSPEWADLPRINVAAVPGLRRLVLVAAHPDDETLGAAGLLQAAAANDLDTVVLVATDGEKSHPNSPTCTPDSLGKRRRGEVADAVSLCHPTATIRYAGLPDGRLASHAAELTESLRSAVDDIGAGALIAAPWSHDGHPDHEAAGTVARIVARECGGILLEYPIWLWHWGTRADLPWERALALPLDESMRSVKRAAEARHMSQVAALSERPGDEVLLGPQVLAHFDRDREIFIDSENTWQTNVFERLHGADTDPWHLASSDYEQAKRLATMRLLPRERFRRAFEPGCSIGVLTAELASRCDELIAMDVSRTAVAAAAERCAKLRNVTVEQGGIPDDWPTGNFDLIVLSEIGYFLTREALTVVAARIRDSLTDDGVVLLCHWRHPVDGWPLDGDEVHDILIETLDLPIVASESTDEFAGIALARGRSDQAVACAGSLD